MHVAHGCADVTVAQETLHGGQVHAGLDQVRGEGVALIPSAELFRVAFAEEEDLWRRGRHDAA
jgi:hypothetical protein